LDEKCIIYMAKKPEVTSPLRRPRHIWEDNIKIDFTEMGMRVWPGFMCRRIGFRGGIL
jgi:hypothetical protein